MADISKSIVFNIEINEKGNITLNKTKVSLKQLDAEFRKTTESIKRQGAAMGAMTKDGLNPMIDKTGLAGATLVELGRTISDMPYGIRGVANNLSQLSTLFTTLIVTTGGVQNGIDSLVSAFRGPLGFIVIFQAAIAAIDYFYGSTKKAKEEQKSFAVTIIDSTKELRRYLTVIDDILLSQGDLNTLLEGAAAADKKLYDFLENSNLSQEERNKLIKEYLALGNAINIVEGKLQKNREEIKEKGEILDLQDIEALEEKIRLAKIIAERTIGQDRAYREANIGLMQDELEQAKINASEITALTLKEAELFKIFAQLRKQRSDLLSDEGDDRDKIDKLLSEEAFARVNGYFEDGIFKLTETQKESFEAQWQIAKQRGMIFVKELDEIGRLYKEQRKREEDSLKAGVAAIKKEAQEISSIFRATQTSLGYVNDVVMSYHDARMQALARERDYILNSGRLTEGQQRAAIREIEKREIAAQKRKIKAERDMFTIKQSLLIAEEIMKAKAAAAEQIRIAKNAVEHGIATTQQVAINAAASVADAQMSIGSFVRALGPYGVAAFGITIGGLIASIFAAKKKANAAIANLGGVSASSSGGDSGGTSFIAPDFNIVGTSGTSQLAGTIAGAEAKATRAYVVFDDIKDASDFDNKTQNATSFG
jgi:biopolymer transport protein ExbD